MQDLYQKAGYPDSKVTYEVSLDKDTGKAILKFKVHEGERVYIKLVKFTGNKAFPDKPAMKIMKTRHHWWGSCCQHWRLEGGRLQGRTSKRFATFITPKGTSTWRSAVRISSGLAPSGLVIIIDIYEGAQYKVGTVAIDGNKIFPTTDLEKHLKMTSGKIFTPTAMAADQKALEDYYGGRGYLDTSVRPIRVPNVETGRIDMTYSIHEGELTYIEKIDIRGNTKTKDKVIRRELAVNPGEIYDTVKVDRSVERLKNLGYFSKVEATPEPTDVPNRKDLVT